MGKSKRKNAPPPSGGLASEGEKALKDEVAAYASQLGLATTSSGMGFDDSDFRPEKAQLRLGEHAKSGQEHVEQVSDELATTKKQRRNKFKPSDGDRGARSAVPPAQAAAAIRERTWNTGVGARPGAQSHVSLIGTADSQIWYQAADELPQLPNAEVAAADDAVVETKTRVAEKLMDSEAKAFEKRLQKHSPADASWLQSVKSSGTMRDKIAAHALLVQESAVANIAALDDLLTIATKSSGGREAAGHAIEALMELFRDVLLPDRKLVEYHSRPFRAAKPSKEGDKRLLFWWCEDCVKQRYAIYVDILERASTDNLDWIKDKALKAAYELLASKPELEARLLTIVINKLGDPNRKIASKAGFLVSCLLTKHPFMGGVVVREVENFVFRPGQKARAQYYAVVTLNQMVLSHNSKRGGAALAVKLIDIYFTIFRLVLDEKMGVTAERKEAAQAPATTSHEKSNASQKGGGKGNRAGSLKSRKKGVPAATQPQGPPAEEVEARMLGALITGVRRAFPFVEGNEMDNVFNKHASQLFRTVHLAPFNVATQALMLLFQVLNAQNAISDRFYGALYAAMLSPELGRSASLSMFLGLVVQAVNADVSTRRAAAFVKRLLQVSCMQQANVACGILLLVSEILKAKPALWSAITHPEDAPGDEAHDATDDDNDEAADAAAAEHAAPQAASVLPRTAAEAVGVEWPAKDAYDMHKRAPQHARAEAACWWELSVLCDHAHPSVATMARTLLAGTSVLYDGDPLKDLMLLAFLDKFVKQKASAKAADKGASVMQPVRSAGVPEGGESVDPAALGSAAFAAIAETDIAPEDVFFHKYFTMQSVQKRRAVNRSKRKAKKDKAGGADGEGVAGDSSSEESIAQDDSDAEDAFLEGEEGMEDDALGDPSIGASFEDMLGEESSDELGSEVSGDRRGDADSDGALEALDMGVAESDDELGGDGAASESVTDVDDSDDDDDDDMDGEFGGAAGASTDITDAELEDLDLDALPSPSTASGSASGSDEEEGAQTRPESRSGRSLKRARTDDPAPSQDVREEDGSDGSDIDEDAFARALFGNSASDEDDVELDEDAVPEDADTPQARGLHQRASGKATRAGQGLRSDNAVDDGGGGVKRMKKRSRSASGPLFAAYDDYVDVLDEIDRQREATQGSQGALPSKSDRGSSRHKKRRPSRRKSA